LASLDNADRQKTRRRIDPWRNTSRRHWLKYARREFFRVLTDCVPETAADLDRAADELITSRPMFDKPHGPAIVLDRLNEMAATWQERWHLNDEWCADWAKTTILVAMGDQLFDRSGQSIQYLRSGFYAQPWSESQADRYDGRDRVPVNIAVLGEVVSLYAGKYPAGPEPVYMDDLYEPAREIEVIYHDGTSGGFDWWDESNDALEIDQWDPRGEERIENAVDRIARGLRPRIRAALERMVEADRQEAEGWPDYPTPTDADLRRLIAFQVNGCTLQSLVPSSREDPGGKSRGTDRIKSQLQETAEAIDLSLRPTRRGRPKANSYS